MEEGVLALVVGGDDEDADDEGDDALVEPLEEEATQLTVYDVAPLTLDMEHDHRENELVQPARAVLHRFVPTPLLM